MGIKVYNIDALWKIDWFIGILTHDQNENQFSSIVEDRNQKRNPVMIGNHNSYIDTNRLNQIGNLSTFYCESRRGNDFELESQNIFTLNGKLIGSLEFQHILA
jgi:hypothetical protein